MSVPFCLPHPVAVSVFYDLWRFVCDCACTEMVWMCVLYVSLRSKVRPRTIGCVSMGSALLFIIRSILLVYSAGSGVNRVQVVLSGFSMILFCLCKAKTVCMVAWISCYTHACVCVDVMVMLSAQGHDLNQCTG